MEKDSKIYIAGHRGLVGSAIWNNLKAKGYTNLVGRGSKELDLTDAAATEDFFAKEKPDYVILAAAHVGGIMANLVYRADFIFKNLAIQNNVIGAAYRHDVKKLLFLGSTCIYPRDAKQPIKEEYLLTGELEYTNEPYAIAKIAGLKMCESFNLQYGTNYIAVMPTNLYGPNDNFNLEKSHVLPALIRKVLIGKALEENDFGFIREDLSKRPVEGVDGEASEEAILEILSKYGVRRKGDSVEVEIWGSGKPLREFLWSEEMADACVYIMERVDFSVETHGLCVSGDCCNGDMRTVGTHGLCVSETDRPSVSTVGDGSCVSNTEIRNCHINIGTGKEISIAGVAELIKKSAGFKGDLYFNASKPDGTMRKLTDVSKLHELGWKHKIDIEEGVEKMIRWYLG